MWFLPSFMISIICKYLDSEKNIFDVECKPIAMHRYLQRVHVIFITVLIINITKYLSKTILIILIH